MSHTSTILAARISLIASLTFVVLLAALHALRPDLDPSWRFISEYELGPDGWVMQLAFFSLGLSCASLFVAIRNQVRGIAGGFALAILLLTAVGMELAAVFVPDPVNRLHEVGAMLDHLPFAAPIINWKLSRHESWKSSKRMLMWTAGLPMLGLILFVGSMATMLPQNGGKPGPSVLVGWPNRIMILAQCVWIIQLARAARANAGPGLPPTTEA